MRDVAQFFKVLADEARLKILWLLFNHQELCVCDIMEALEITQSKASRHLISLRHAGLVRDRKDGLWSYYSLNLVEDELSKQHLQVLQKTLARHPDSMGLLNKLHMWIETRNRGVICAENNACAASKKRRAAAKAVSGGQR